MKTIKYLLAGFLCLSAIAQAEVTLKGDVMQGGMVVGYAPNGSTITFNQQTLKQGEDGSFVFGFGRDAESGDVLKVVYPGGDVWEQTFVIEPREYNIQYVNGIDKKIQSKDKPPEVWERIRQESAMVKKARKDHQELLAFNKPFKWPLIGPITGVFGSQRVYNGEPGRPHYGVDIGMPTGTEVYAPQDGVVTLAHPDMYYSGGTIILDHGYGISSTFLHLSKLHVEVGAVIKQGDLIGEVGASGRASGPHLDWRMNWYTRRIDPQLLVPDMNTLLQQAEQE